jgi:hypothetical protein
VKIEFAKPMAFELTRQLPFDLLRAERQARCAKGEQVSNNAMSRSLKFWRNRATPISIMGSESHEILGYRLDDQIAQAI